MLPCVTYHAMYTDARSVEGIDMEEIKQIPVTADVTEIQLWSNGVFIGAGAWTNPITESKLSEAKKRIIDSWLLT